MTIEPVEFVGRKFSYTRCEKDDQCQRARYLGREWGGTGLMAVKAGWPLVYGNILHSFLETFAKSGQIDLKAVTEKVHTQGQEAGFDGIACRDWTALMQGHLLGFKRTVWPALMSEYEVMDTERWIEWEPKEGFLFRARQDLLLTNKFDGHIAYVDYKTTSTDKPQWIASWAKSVQLHSSMYAIKQAQGIDVQRAIVIGFYKGYQDKKTKVQRSPFTYGYANYEYSMVPSFKYDYQRGKGWELFSPLDGYEDGMEGWVANMPIPTLTEQFPQTAPIFPRNDIAETWFRQQLIREAEVGDAMLRLWQSQSVEEITTILDTHFKQNFKHCQPPYGYDCEFAPVCWQPWVESDPIGSGLFKKYESDVEASE